MVRHYIINMEVQGSNLALCMYYIFFIFSSFLQICLLHPVRLSPAFFIRFFLAVLLLAGLPFPSYRYAVFLLAGMPLCPVLAESPCPIRRDQNATFHVVCKLHYDTHPLQTRTSSGMCRSCRCSIFTSIRITV